MKKRKEKHPEKHKKMARKSKLKREYGISLEEYDGMLSKQGGVCANNGCMARKSRQGFRLNVDHDHKTGEVRGLLCSDCNLSLGMLGDDVGKIAGLISYLENWRK